MSSPCGVICQTCLTSQCGYCLSTCQKTCQYCESTCENCQSCEGCQSNCETSCQSSCEKACQTSCLKGCQSTCERACQTGAQKNVAPGIPNTITVPANAKYGSSILIKWGTSNDTNLAGYKLERSVDNGTYTQIYQGSSREFTDTIGDGWSAVRYRVRAYDSYNVHSSYATSNYVTVIKNVAPTISGADGEIGNFVKGFVREYYVDDGDATQKLDVIVTLNGANISTITNAERQKLYEINITPDLFKNLAINEKNTIQIHVTDNQGGNAYRRWYFYRTNSAPIVTVTKADLGVFGHEVNDGPNISFKASDADLDTMTAKVYLNDKIIGDIGEIQQDTLVDYKVDTLTYRQLSNGVHILKVEVKDSKGAFGFNYIKFEKKVTKAFYTIKIDTTVIVNSVVVVKPAMDLRDGAEMVVKVSNNPKDNVPVWETVPKEKYGQFYDFENLNSTNFGLEIRYEFDRGTAVGDSYVYGLVGRYD